MKGFQSLTADIFHAGGRLFAEDFSSFDRLDFRRNKMSADSFSVLDSLVFHLDRDFAKRQDFSVR